MRRAPGEGIQMSKSITRRTLVAGGLQLAVAGALASRMHFLQVKESDRFRLLADENRINIRLQAPARGLIFDRKGRPVAINSPSYKVVIVREDAGDVMNVLADLQKLVPIDPGDLQKAVTEIRRRSPFVPVTVTEKLSWDEFAKVAANSPSLPGITTEVGLSRDYPQKAIFAHVVGYVGPVSDFDLQKIEDPDPLLKIPRFQIGKFGVEAEMEHTLRGKAGNKKIEVNAVGRVMRELDRQPGIQGATIQLTTDTKVQSFMQARMDGVSASAVLIDLEDGDIHAIGSAPTFDPNLFVRGISVADYSVLRDHQFGPLRAKAVQGTYAPASTFKMVVALAGLEAGVVDPRETVRCRGHLEVSGTKFHCWHPSHGRMSLHQAIVQSCDVYFYDLALKVGIEKISAMARKLGIGVKHELPLSAVQRGVAPTKEWKKRSFEKDWLVGDTVNASIGQGYVLASPLQLAIMNARIASGKMIEPRLIRSIDGVELPSGLGADLDIDPQHLAWVRNAMTDVSNTSRGTGYRARFVEPELKMAGKTGTAQVRNISKRERELGITKNKDLPWNRRDHALFVGHAPAENPKFAISVIVEHGGSGGSVAAPIARDILLFALKGKMPPLSSYPPEVRSQIAEEQIRWRELMETQFPETEVKQEFTRA